MPHTPTSLTAWTTPQQFNSGEVATSTAYNNLVNDVGLLYAKPWMMAYLNATLSSVTTASQIFNSSTTTISNSPASPAGVITLSTGTFTVPLDGVYRVTMTATMGLQSSPPAFNMICTTAGGTAANNATFNTQRITGSSTQNTGTFGSFIWTFSKNGTTGAYPTSMTFSIGTSATLSSLLGSTAPNFGNGTYVQIEYLGTSNGSI
jgi:hypothetical protein